MPPTSDVLENLVARGLLLDLADRGVSMKVQHGALTVWPMARVAPYEVELLRRHRDDLRILVLVCDDRTLDRLLEMRAGRLGQTITTTAGHCHCCSDLLPDDREHGRCGWCAVAARLYAGGPVPADVLRLFPPEVRGLEVPVPALADQALAFDLEVPA
jgi:hypothetical protein